MDYNRLFHLGIKAALSDFTQYQVFGLSSPNHLTKTLHNSSGMVLIGMWSSPDNPYPSPADLFQILAEIQQLQHYRVILMGSANGWFIHYLIRHHPCIHGYLHNADDLCVYLPVALQTIEGNDPTADKNQQVFFHHVLSVADLTHRLYLSPTASTLALECYRRKEHLLELNAEDIKVLREIAYGVDEAAIAAKLGVSRQRIYTISRRRRFEASTNEDLMVRVMGGRGVLKGKKRISCGGSVSHVY